MAKCILLLICWLAVAMTTSAAPVNSDAKPTVSPPKEKACQGTPQSSPNGNNEALASQEDQQQVGRTQATPTQTRMGRAASTPSKRIPHPCPGCFSVIGDPGTPPKTQ